jgi:hypothetical protein
MSRMIYVRVHVFSPNAVSTENAATPTGQTHISCLHCQCLGFLMDSRILRKCESNISHSRRLVQLDTTEVRIGGNLAISRKQCYGHQHIFIESRAVPQILVIRKDTVFRNYGFLNGTDRTWQNGGFFFFLIFFQCPSQIRYSLWTEWKLVYCRNAFWTVNQQDEGKWEDLGRGGKAVEPEQYWVDDNSPSPHLPLLILLFNVFILLLCSPALISSSSKTEKAPKQCFSIYGARIGCE